MLRRCISLLLVIGFIAGQLAPVPHAHGAGDAAVHDARPHVHLAWFCHDHEHEQHDHGHQTAPPRSLYPGCDHDSDAVYFDSNPIPNRIAGPDLAKVTSEPIAPLYLAVSTCTPTDRPSAMWAHTPSLRAPDCALYLTLRALRI